uniref:RNA helicase n=1 Tax=Globodera pallida TaxID=36090 RepID=A0A183BPK4_GLOPA
MQFNTNSSYQFFNGEAANKSKNFFNGQPSVNNNNNWNNHFSQPKANPARSSAASLSSPIKKNNYKPLDTVLNRPQAEVDKWLSENDVKLSGHNVPNPVSSFKESTYPAPIIAQLSKTFQQPTAIQTGSGKTLGFTLPAIVHVLNQRQRRPGDGPAVVILLPTRELAQQVETVAREYGEVMRLNVCSCYGGASKWPQLATLKRGVDICIATPGRLNDFISSNAVSLARCSFLVLDEADRMLDMGFEPQIRQIISGIRHDPVHLTVGSLELSANHNIEQNVEVLNEHRKPQRLNELLLNIQQKQNEAKTIVFVSTKRTADTLTRQCIHGDKDQNERNWVLNQFREGKVTVLLATDVAARGIDIHDVSHVINYDYPNNSEDYVHRIGRTGRRDQQGTAYTFFTSNNGAKAGDLIKVLTEANQNIPEDLSALAAMGGRGGRGGFDRWSSGGGGGYGGGQFNKRGKNENGGNRSAGGGSRSVGGGGSGGRNGGGQKDWF